MTHPNKQAFFRQGHEAGFAPGSDERIARSAGAEARAQVGAIAKAMREPVSRPEQKLPEEFTGPAIAQLAKLIEVGNWEMAEIQVRRIAGEWELWQQAHLPHDRRTEGERLAIPVSEMGLPRFAVEMLESRGIFTAGSLKESFPDRLIGARRCGVDTVKRIAAKLVAIGLLTSEAALSAVGRWQLAAAAS